MKDTHTFDGCRESRLDSVNLHASKLFPQLLLLSCPLCRHHSALHLDAQRPLHQRVATGCVLHLALPEAAGALIQIAVHLTAVCHLATTVQMLSSLGFIKCTVGFVLPEVSKHESLLVSSKNLCVGKNFAIITAQTGN